VYIEVVSQNIILGNGNVVMRKNIYNQFNENKQ